MGIVYVTVRQHLPGLYTKYMKKHLNKPRAYLNITECIWDKANSRHGLAGLYHGQTIIAKLVNQKPKKKTNYIVRRVDRFKH